ncbi:MAG: response regulator transcription factor [Anaerolineae bacterium]|nr:response regulator transcription factor [Anaerolineae bacterium]
MSQPHILIVDDNDTVRYILTNTLKHQGYVIDSASDGSEALQKLVQTSYDLMLLDLHMSPVDGLEVLHQIREKDPLLSVIILTAYSSVESAVDALRLGAFDYLFKPAAPDAIRQRVYEGIQHRQQLLHQQNVLNQIDTLRQTLNALEPAHKAPPPLEPATTFIQSGRLIIDPHHRQATLDDTSLDLTTAEFDVLVCLVKAAPNPVSPQELVKCALGYEVEMMEARDITKWHIHHLRRKIETDKTPRYIKTIRHKGYLWSGQ